MKRGRGRKFTLQWLSGNGKLFVVCILLFGISAITSFFITFPADLVQQRLLAQVSQQTGINVQGQNAAMLFPVGLGLDLTVAPEITGLKDLEFAKLQITPAWLTLLSGTVAVSLNSKFGGGDIDAEITTDSVVDATFDEIAVAFLQQDDLPYRLNGLLSGYLKGVNIGSKGLSSGEFALDLVAARVQGLDKIGLAEDLLIGNMLLEGSLGKKRINLQEINILGGVLEVSGGGNIVIASRPNKTRLNLNIRLRPTATTPDNLRELIQIAGIRPTVDGSYLIRIGGTLAKPVIR